MTARSGSAVVLAMLLLVLLNAVGMYVVSAPVSVGDGPRRHYQSRVARNMAIAGAHAAIALLPAVFPENAPLVRRIPSGPDTTGGYSVASRRIAAAEGAAGGEYELVSEGSVHGSSVGTFRVRALVRAGTVSGARPRIVRWEEYAPLPPSDGPGR